MTDRRNPFYGVDCSTLYMLGVHLYDQCIKKNLASEVYGELCVLGDEAAGVESDAVVSVWRMAEWRRRGELSITNNYKRVAAFYRSLLKLGAPGHNDHRLKLANFSPPLGAALAAMKISTARELAAMSPGDLLLASCCDHRHVSEAREYLDLSRVFGEMLRWYKEDRYDAEFGGFEIWRRRP